MTAVTTIQTPAEESLEVIEQVPEIIHTFKNYGLTWLVYAALTFLMVGILWYAIRNWHFLIKWLFASVIFAGALTPTHPSEYATTYSPLILSSMVELFDGNQATFMADIKTIALYWAILFAAGIVIWFGIRRFKAQSENGRKEKQPMDTEAVMATPVDSHSRIDPKVNEATADKD
ncbi:hypothetical protein [Kangiella sp. TOML190]|uniref:hypothetical protein n=1 Tax=Kangiella sp. TOML190 TaxID=2931351 RepID=UPI00203D0E3D|nr:hypothetical protein [Kangiella sp. TOML190]